MLPIKALGYMGLGNYDVTSPGPSYERGALLGEGASSRVYSVAGGAYAMKVTSVQEMSDPRPE